MTQAEIITVSKKGQVVLPKDIREELGIETGTKLFLVQKKDKLTLTKIDSLLEKEKREEGLFTTLASEKSLAKSWLSKEEDEAWKGL
jgi:AbrB family looped-hinge helix DNA binding protein